MGAVALALLEPGATTRAELIGLPCLRPIPGDLSGTESARGWPLSVCRGFGAGSALAKSCCFCLKLIACGSREGPLPNDPFAEDAADGEQLIIAAVEPTELPRLPPPAALVTEDESANSLVSARGEVSREGESAVRFVDIGPFGLLASRFGEFICLSVARSGAIGLLASRLIE